MNWSPFERPLGEITIGDLQKIVDEAIPEGLHLEYKRDWATKQVGRAVTAFANSPGGGWLLIGLEANKLIPQRWVGIDFKGSIDEAVVSAIRSLVAPVPPFAFQCLTLDNGNKAVIVKASEGLQPPYIFRPTGQILIRTPTHSEPAPINDQTALYRLYSRGVEGRAWAHDQASSFFYGGIDSGYPDYLGLCVRAIPAIAGGIGANERIFTHSFVNLVSDNVQRVANALMFSPPFANLIIEMGADRVKVIYDEGSWGRLSITVTIEGLIWIGGVGHRWAGESRLLEFVEASTPALQSLVETGLGHFGFVSIAASTRWAEDDKSTRGAHIFKDEVRIRDLTDADVLAYLGRQLRRFLGRNEYEPESE